jgi:DNA polymerase
MIDIFSVLDAAIAEIGQKRRATSRGSRQGDAAEVGTGTPNFLEVKEIPALPVVPAAKDDIDGEIVSVSENTCHHVSDCGEIAPKVSTFKSTGTTGITETIEDLCGSESSRRLFEHGNYGNAAEAPTAATPIEQSEIAFLAEHGLVIDFETRSVADLRETGLFVYAKHWSTEVWVACYAIGSGPVRGWLPSDKVPADLAAHVRAGLPIIAHNAFFERVIWATVMSPRRGWPEPRLEQWHCTAAMAAAMAIPRKLEKAAEVLGCTFQKDMPGHRLMLKMAKPRTVGDIPCFFCGAIAGEEAASPDCLCHRDHGWRINVTWHDDAESIKRGTEYCIRDVETERELLTKLRPLSAFEREVWLLDQRINERGVSVDLPAARNSRLMVEELLVKLNTELSRLTDGAVTAATQVAKLLTWLRSRGVALSEADEGNNLGKEDVEALLKTDLPPVCRRALQIRLEAAKTSTSKLNAYIARTSADGRMRDNLLYQGAGRTGRWAGKGAQLQNLPRGGVEQVEDLLAIIRNEASPDFIELFGPPLEVVSACLRPMLMAATEHELIGADYNAIEARGTAWLAGAERMLGIFARGDDPYRDMASQIYGRPADSFSKSSRERQLGKIAVLGLGYQMGSERFRQSCAKEGVVITEHEAEKVKRIYREANREIVQLWNTLEAAAIRALRDPGTWFYVANERIGFVKEDAWLYLRLPSGRCLTYANPKYEQVDTPIGPRWSPTFDGVSSGTYRWERQKLYGGKLTENAVQAICRDLLATAMLHLDEAGYRVVLHIHDEVVAEVPEGAGDVREFERLMCEVPDWAQGFPMKTEGWRATRYRK